MKLPKLDLNITNRCNYRCVHCAFDSGKKKIEEMSLEEITKILKQTKELGGEKFDITGGEALVRKDVKEIISIGKDLGYKIELITNGSLLTKEKINNFKKAGLDSIAVSVDGHEYKSHARIRRISRQTYDKVMRNIDLILEKDIKLKINTAVFESNYKNLHKITEWAAKKGCAEHGIYYFTSIGRGLRHKERSVDPKTWLNYARKEFPRFKNIKVSLEVPFIEKNKLQKEHRCLAEAEQYHLQILPNGDVFPCAIMASYNHPLANLKNTSIKDIWKNKNLWNNYWNKINTRCCVDYSGSFNQKDYDNYKAVCPLRKYKVEDLR